MNSCSWLLGSANRYITGLGKAKYKYLTKILKNYTELGSEDGFQEMHWVQNKLNGLGMYTYDHKDFPLWTKVPPPHPYMHYSRVDH